MFGLFRRFFGTQNERELKKLEPAVQAINAMEEEVSSLGDDEIRQRAARLREELRLGREENREEVDKVREAIATSTSDTERSKHKKRLKEVKNRALDGKIPEVFALVREASRRTIGLRHFNVQLMGGIVLHQGKIAEMATGEGKTLVATLAASLNALAGESVHIVTVNDYLAKRDCQWMGPIYKFLGLSVGVIQNDMRNEERKKAYACDIVYGTNNEFGFDYLRDNMVADKDDVVQGPPSFAIVDEVDSILIDEARTPLIISGPVDETNEAYNQMRPIVAEIVNAQRKLISEYIAKFRTSLRDQKKDEAGELLYLIHKADPKNREFLDIILRIKAQRVYWTELRPSLTAKSWRRNAIIFLKIFFMFLTKRPERPPSAPGARR